MRIIHYSHVCAHVRVHVIFQAELFLLPPVKVQDKNKKCVVIDLDETLVHSSFTVNYPIFYYSNVSPYFAVYVFTSDSL